MPIGLRLRLSLMMFLQYYVWGIWLPILGLHLGSKSVGLNEAQIGWVYTVYGLGAILGPFVWRNWPTATWRRRSCWLWPT